MTKFTIELPESFDVASRGKSVTVKVADLSAAIIAQLALHGLRQKVSDAASGAAKAAEGTDMDAAAMGKVLMQKAVDALAAGDWTQRAAGEAVPDDVKHRRAILRAQLKKVPASWAKVKDLDDAAQAEALDALYAKQPDAGKAMIDDMVAERIAEAEARKAQAAKLAKAVAFDL